MGLPLPPGETLVREGAANLHRGWEAVGGHLYLTDQSLRFQSHAFNVQTGATEIPLSEIVSLRLCWTRFLGHIPIFPNSLAVTLADGNEHHFVVHGRKRWAEAIQRQLNAR